MVVVAALAVGTLETGFATGAAGRFTPTGCDTCAGGVAEVRGCATGAFGREVTLGGGDVDSGFALCLYALGAGAITGASGLGTVEGALGFAGAGGIVCAVAGACGFGADGGGVAAAGGGGALGVGNEV